MIARIGAGILLLLGATVLASAAGTHRNWGVGLAAQYDSNLGLSSINPRGATVFSVSPFYTLQRSAARGNTTFTYAPRLVLYPDGTFKNQFWQYLNANSDIELVRNNVFLDAYATANPNIISPDRAVGGIGGISATDPNNLSQTFTAGITPSFRFRMKDYAAVNIAPGLNYVYNSEGGIGNYWAANATVTIASGTYFFRMPWSLSYDASLLNNRNNDNLQAATDNQDNYNFQTTTGTVGYIFNRKWAVYLTLAYDNNSYASNDSTSGFGWQAGMTWTPTTRTSLTAGYGDRYFGSWPRFTFSHRAPHTVWSARWESTVYNARQELLGQPVVPLADALGNPNANPLTQNQTLLQAGSPALINTVYVNNTFNATVAGDWQRTVAAVDFNYYDRKYQGLPLDTTDYTVYGTIARKLSPRTSVNFSLQWWDHSEDRVEGIDYTQKVAAIWLQRNVTPHLSSTLEYSYTRRSSNDPLNEYDNNQVFLAIVFSPSSQGQGTTAPGGAGLSFGTRGSRAPVAQP